MTTKKDRRHSGYVTPHANISKKDFVKENLFIDPFYDDWEDYRDGFRDWFKDFKKIKKINGRRSFLNEDRYNKRIRMNAKQKRLLKIRKAKKSKDDHY
ncbi:MAG: hypothetical protein AABX51_06820 [Nanoarchaeota archaeon]